VITQSTGDETSYVVPSDVLFPTASAVISPQGQGVLQELVPELHDAVSITVGGCTDSVGGVDSPYNLNLSQQRADEAVEYLERDGLPVSLFHALAWADTHPVTTTAGLDTATINALNRRIVVIVTK
jgi:outer membrane protein OmpA-like peptidoglycan-associated protein